MSSLSRELLFVEWIHSLNHIFIYMSTGNEIVTEEIFLET